MVQKSTEEHRIYVASLTDYNNGILHGVWIDLDYADAEDVWEQIREMLKASPAAKKYGDIAEEWAIHDYENVNVNGEYADIYELIEEVEIRNEVGDEPWEGYIEWTGGVEVSREGFEDSYRGCYKSEEEYAMEFFEDCYGFQGISDIFSMYFDWEAYTRDLFIQDMYSYQPAYDRVYVSARN